MICPKFHANQTPLRLLVCTALFLFVAEAVVMIVFALLPPLPIFLQAALDAALLVVVSLPILYYFIFVPMLHYISEKKRSEKELRAIQDTLEEKVLNRTKELAQKNVHLDEQLNILRLSADVGVVLTEIVDLQTMLEACCESVVLNLDVAFARIWLLDESENLLVLKASAGMYTNLNGNHSRKGINAETKIGNIVLTKKPYISNQIIGDSQIIDQDWAKLEKMQAFAGHPLIIGEKVIGVLALFSRNTLGETTMLALATLANEVTIGIERLYQTDQLRAEMKKTQQYLDIVRVMLVALDASGRITLLNQ